MRTQILALVVLLASAITANADELQVDSFDSNGVKISYLTAGSGDPILLVHGLYSSAQMNWVLPGIVKLLAQNHLVIAPDLRGHGKSDKPTNDSDYGQPMADDIVRLMDHLQVTKAQVVGYSLGGIIVMKLAVDHPDRVKSVALGGMGWLKDGSHLQEVWEKLPGRSGTQTPVACVHGIARLAVTEDQVKALKIPIEMLVGDRDPCRKMYADPLHALRPDFPEVIIENAGHMNCVGKSDFKDELKKWLDRS